MADGGITFKFMYLFQSLEVGNTEKHASMDSKNVKKFTNYNFRELTFTT